MDAPRRGILVKVLLVDGYNVIRLTPPYRELAETDLESARAALVSDVAAFAADEWDATVVFDGGANPLSDGRSHREAGITVVFSRFGAEADAVVESLARTARERGDAVEVVTSDAQTQWAVFGKGVARRSSAEFSASLRQDRAEWAEHNPAGASRTRVEDLIDASVRARLERWARGEG